MVRTKFRSIYQLIHRCPPFVKSVRNERSICLLAINSDRWQMFFSDVDCNRVCRCPAFSWLCKSLPCSSLTLKKQQWHYTNGLAGRDLKPETPGFLPGDWANHVNFPGCRFHSFKSGHHDMEWSLGYLTSQGCCQRASGVKKEQLCAACEFMGALRATSSVWPTATYMFLGEELLSW